VSCVLKTSQPALKFFKGQWFKMSQCSGEFRAVSIEIVDNKGDISMAKSNAFTVAEACIGHVRKGDAAIDTYNRTAYVMMRAPYMNAWAAYVSGKI